MAGSAGVGQEVRANRLESALGGGGDLADELEVLVSGPALGEGGQWTSDNRDGRHVG